ncbi:hypothetical protein [Hydrogenophaga intermedia]|uniref:hypothetical protein n=1 Tax=Hydrogenophaga intermedia TaxID=65786 RepID=UPI0020448166|nr:hypothetical protein [Hydrogenophaga intermedia]MCM3565903.1 hypothetical protein [Hydrogenophaga intermedia]
MGESVKLGTGRCPVCGSVKARYTLSAKQLAVITCNACNFQGFARSEHSDEKLRALITPEAAPPPAPAADPSPAPTPAPLPPPPPPAPAPAPRRSLMQW